MVLRPSSTSDGRKVGAVDSRSELAGRGRARTIRPVARPADTGEVVTDNEARAGRAGVAVSDDPGCRPSRRSTARPAPGPPSHRVRRRGDVHPAPRLEGGVVHEVVTREAAPGLLLGHTPPVSEHLLIVPCWAARSGVGVPGRECRPGTSVRQPPELQDDRQPVLALRPAQRGQSSTIERSRLGPAADGTTIRRCPTSGRRHLSGARRRPPADPLRR